MLFELQATGSGPRALFSVKPGSVSVSLDEKEVYSFDLQGRLITGWVDDQTYVRTLDNRIIKKWRDGARGGPWKSIRQLESREKQHVLNRTCARMRALARMASAGKSPERVRELLGKIVAWDYLRLEREREKFLAVYTPVSILPPDQYFALVLQATEGCHWNRCTFCSFYREGRFRIKSDEEFGEHIREVKDFFGEAIKLRRSIFLGDANALVIPQDRLLRIFDRVNQEFTIVERKSDAAKDRNHHSFEGIHSFVDAFNIDKKTAADFNELRIRNLRRVYVGVETGCDELLEFLNKPATAGQILENLTVMKQAGLSVGVIILIGVGGDYYARAHVERTVHLLNDLRLGRGDIVYFSPLVESPESDYSQRAARAGIRPLTEEERREQLQAIRAGLRFAGDAGPVVSLYDIREFVY
jgi:radical SAM superfamily enzyme YgiQ (UPF0313 family)